MLVRGAGLLVVARRFYSTEAVWTARQWSSLSLDKQGRAGSIPARRFGYETTATPMLGAKPAAKIDLNVELQQITNLKTLRTMTAFLEQQLSNAANKQVTQN